jgi:DNA polymerase elongation subunit (family B)
MLLQNNQIRDMLFLDIETVPRVSSFDLLEENWQNLWLIKHNTFKDASQISPEETYNSKAGIFAEFGKIICISIGYFHYDKTKQTDIFRVKSFAGDNENVILDSFADLLCKHFKDADKWQLTGHNIREFDIPYLCRRIVANGIALPDILDLSGRKPWEINIVDTLQQWRFGDFKNYTSLKLIAATLGIPSPKDDIEGKDVAKVYWQDKDLERIQRYCERDVQTVARIILQLKGEPSRLNDNDCIIV